MCAIGEKRCVRRAPITGRHFEPRPMMRIDAARSGRSLHRRHSTAWSEQTPGLRKWLGFAAPFRACHHSQRMAFVSFPLRIRTTPELADPYWALGALKFHLKPHTLSGELQPKYALAGWLDEAAAAALVAMGVAMSGANSRTRPSARLLIGSPIRMAAIEVEDGISIDQSQVRNREQFAPLRRALLTAVRMLARRVDAVQEQIILLRACPLPIERRRQPPIGGPPLLSNGHAAQPRGFACRGDARGRLIGAFYRRAEAVVGGDDGEARADRHVARVEARAAVIVARSEELGSLIMHTKPSRALSKPLAYASVGKTGDFGNKGNDDDVATTWTLPAASAAGFTVSACASAHSSMKAGLHNSWRRARRCGRWRWRRRRDWYGRRHCVGQRPRRHSCLGVIPPDAALLRKGSAAAGGSAVAAAARSPRG